MADSCVLFTVPEAAAALGVDPVTVHRWMKAGRIKAVKIVRGAAIFTGAEVARVGKLPAPRRGRVPRHATQAETLPGAS